MLGGGHINADMQQFLENDKKVGRYLSLLEPEVVAPSMRNMINHQMGCFLPIFVCFSTKAKKSMIIPFMSTALERQRRHTSPDSALLCCAGRRAELSSDMVMGQVLLPIEVTTETKYEMY